MNNNSMPDPNKQAEIERLANENRELRSRLIRAYRAVRWCEIAIDRLNQRGLTHAQKEGVLLLVCGELEAITMYEHVSPPDELPF